MPTPVPIPIEVVADDEAARAATRALLERASEAPLAFDDARPVLRLIVSTGGAPPSAEDSVDVAFDPGGPQAAEDAARLVECARRRAAVVRSVPTSQHHLGAIFDSYGRATAIVSRDGRLLDLNHAARALLARPVRELLGAHADDLLAAGEPSLGPREFRGASRRTQTATRRFRRGRDGTIELLSIVHPVRDADGRPLFFVVELSDPVHQAFAARDREQSEALAHALRRIDGLAARGSHPQRVYAEILRRHCALLDAREALVARSQGPGRPLRVQAVHAPDRQLHLDDLIPADGILPGREDSLVGRALLTGETVVTRASMPLCGSAPERLRVENAVAFPLRRFGELVGVIVVSGAARGVDRGDVAALRPLTATCAGIIAAELERERRAVADERLAEQERTIDTLLANLPGVIFRAQDDDLRTLTFASAGVESLLGVAAEAVCGEAVHGLLEYTAGADRESVLEELRWAILQRRRFDATYRMLRDGETIWVHEQSQGVFGADGDLLFVEGFLTDVTASRRAAEERRRLEGRIRRAQKIDSLATLAEGVARDYNNLLLGVIGNTQLLEDRLTHGDEEARAALERIEEAAGRAADLTRYMLAYTGQEQVLLESQPAASIVRRSLPLIERQLTPEVTLELDLDGCQARIAADAGPLQRALVEAVRNAVEAQPRGGRVRIALGLEPLDAPTLAEFWLGSRLDAGEYVVLSVEDDGTGMDEAVRQRAFDPFFSTRGEGRGLGLAAVLGATRSHGGAVRIESAPDRGTRLTLVLPRVPDAVEPVHELRPRAPLRAADSAERRVLVVDDESMVREVARRLLERSGFQVECAHDGADAVARVAGAGDAFDAVLLDLSMPGQDGMATLEELRRLRPDLPVLMSSGHADQRVLDRLHSLPAVGFLRKPYRLSELLEKLDAAVDGARTRS